MSKTLSELLAEVIYDLETAHNNACSCCNSSEEVKDHCQGTINKIKEWLNEKTI